MMKSVSFFILILLSLNSCEQKTSEEQVIEWVSNHAVPFNSVLPGSDSHDLLPLKDMVGNARIVSLGEPTHGNREVFQLKHRMIEFLVTEMGFNLFALECPFGEAYDINRYVVDGIGDPEKALAGIYVWTWDTQEVLEMLKWMRAYNADPSHKKKIKFFGFDPQDPLRAARVTLEYLAKVDPDLEKQVRPELGILEVPFSNPDFIGRRQYISEEYDSLSLRDIRQVMDAFVVKKDEYVGASSLSEWTLAQHHARQVEIYIEANTEDGENYNTLRDSGQAENLKWIMNQEDSAAKMIVWAHNSHVSNSSRWGTEWMGNHLKQLYGDELKIFGFFFNQGSFKATDQGTPSRGMYDFSVESAPSETFEHIMASTKFSLAALEMNKLPVKGIVYDWFNQERPTRNSGGRFNEEEAKKFFWPYNLNNAFDVLVYLDSTTAVISINDSDNEYMIELDKKLPTPLNTGFENNNSGETPDSWEVWSKFNRLGVTMSVSDKNPYSGKNSALLHRPKGLSYGEIAPNLRQKIDATAYRGKTIRLKAAVRAELDDSSFAFLRLAIEPDHLDDLNAGLSPLFDSLDKYRVKSEDWKIYEIEAQVDNNADVIHYGIYLRDFGSVWLDDVQIEIVE